MIKPKINSKELLKFLKQVTAKLTKGVWAPVVQNSIIAYAKSRIDKQIDINNKPFTALAKATIAGKGHSKALYLTGKMYNSFRIVANGNKLKFINDAPYSAIHQFGLNGVPKREFMGPPPNLSETILDYLDFSK